MPHHVMKRIRHSRRITVYPLPYKALTLEESGIRYIWMDFAYTIADKYANYKKHCISWFNEQMTYFDTNEPDFDENAIIDVPPPKTCVLVIAGFPTKLVADLRKHFAKEEVDCFVPFGMSKTRLSAIYNVLAMQYDEITVVSIGIMNGVAMEILHENGLNNKGKVVKIVVISPVFAINMPNVKNKIIVNGRQNIVERIEGNITIIECESDDVVDTVFAKLLL